MTCRFAAGQTIPIWIGVKSELKSVQFTKATKGWATVLSNHRMHGLPYIQRFREQEQKHCALNSADFML